MSGMGLSSSDEEFDSPEQPPTRNSGLGLNSDSDDNQESETFQSAPKPSLDLDSDDDDAPTTTPAMNEDEHNAMLDRELGLDSDSENEPQAPPKLSQAPQGPVSHYSFSIPTLPSPRSQSKAYTVRMPDQLGVMSTEFTESGFQNFLQSQETSLSNFILWRYKRDDNGEIVTDDAGVPERESNTRIVKWSDGSLQLQVGPDFYDIQIMPNAGYLYAKQHSLNEDGTTSTILESQKELAGRMHLRHSEIADATLKIMHLHDPSQVAEKRTQMYSQSADPTRKTRKAPQKRSRPRPKPKMHAQFLEQDSVSAVKARYTNSSVMFDDDSDDLDDDDESDLEERRGGATPVHSVGGKRQASAVESPSPKPLDQSEQEEEEEGDEEEEEEEDFISKKRTRVSAHNELDDDEDD